MLRSTGGERSDRRNERDEIIGTVISGGQVPELDCPLRSWMGVRRAIAAAVVVAAALSACGEGGLLDGVGDRSRSVVYGDTTAPTTLIESEGEEAPLGARASSGLSWYNDSIVDQNIGEPSFTASHVWARREEGERIVQASRAEIAASVPGIKFPRLVPEDVGWVTSQLVFDAASATLDADTSAQFGIWQIQPYTGDEGRVAILRVGDAQGGSEEGIRPEVVEAGLSLNWIDRDQRYELFCRATLPEELCWQMAESMVPLDSVLPEATF
jgi:hypothetical protein